MPSLIESLKIRILSIIDSVQPSGKYKCLILDDYTEHLVYSIFQAKNGILAEILNHNVSNIAKVDQNRKTEPYLDAVYLLKPNRYVIECLKTDFSMGKPRYAAAHVFLLPTVQGDSESLSSQDYCLKVKNSAIGRYSKTIKTVHVDFFPRESQIFSLNNPESLEIFYNQHCLNLVTSQVKAISQQLTSVCATLGEYPVIRFFKPPSFNVQLANPKGEFTYLPQLQDIFGNHPNPAQVLPFMIANQFQQDIDDYARLNNDFPDVENSERPRSIFLILDRTIDMKAPLLHEFTYQAMIHDLIKLSGHANNEYEYSYPKGDSNIMEDKKALLDESDKQWVALRHLHMQDALLQLNNTMTQLIKENPHLANTKSSLTISDMQDSIAALPMFAGFKENYSMHLQMIEKCLTSVTEKDLNSVADFEQICATGGVDSDNRNIRLGTITDQLVSLIHYDATTSTSITRTNMDRVRLILLYLLHKGEGIFEQDFQKLKIHAKLNDYDMQVIRNCSQFGLPISKKPVPDDLKAAGLDSKSFEKQHRAYEKEYEKYKKHVVNGTLAFSTIDTDQPFITSRFLPGIKKIVEGLVKNQLHSSLFPYTKDEPDEKDEESGTFEDEDYRSSLRNPRTKASWAKPSAVSSSPLSAITSNPGNSNGSSMGLSPRASRVKQAPREQRIFIYLVGGGITMSEARTIYELSRKYPNKEIFLGGDDILTPSSFLRSLSRLNTDRAGLRLQKDTVSNDISRRKIPEYLFASANPIQTPTIPIVPTSTNVSSATISSSKSNSPKFQSKPNRIVEEDKLKKKESKTKKFASFFK
ncbi:Sec1-like protein [Nadsonia fulvescens var. elongata DSM 6958]|uniref:Sec1-like protein n=1 Tax=Nadsonia fulvescens var. elongata DSM 6958 TaxID=857566 RepID=A0A1E3PQ05_9ASCO|nr:Sec1-like protein [Nadsonia fulvescens var. elongata DSM 6958]